MERMREKAKDQHAREVSASNFIRVDNGRMMMGETELPEEFEVIILDFAHTRAYYSESFDPKNLAPPECFSLAMAQTDLVPHETSPNKKAESCLECELSAWVGSTPPDCGKRRSLAIIDNNPENDEIYRFTVSPAGLKAWKKYANPFLSQDISLCAVRTIMSADVDPDRLGLGSGKVAKYEMAGYVEDAGLIEKIERLMGGAEKELLTPPDVSGARKPSASKKVSSKKKASKKVNRPVRRAKV